MPWAWRGSCCSRSWVCILASLAGSLWILSSLPRPGAMAPSRPGCSLPAVSLAGAAVSPAEVELESLCRGARCEPGSLSQSQSLSAGLCLVHSVPTVDPWPAGLLLECVCVYILVASPRMRSSAPTGRVSVWKGRHMIPPAQGGSREGLGSLRHRTLSVVLKILSICPVDPTSPTESQPGSPGASGCGAIGPGLRMACGLRVGSSRTSRSN